MVCTEKTECVASQRHFIARSHAHIPFIAVHRREPGAGNAESHAEMRDEHAPVRCAKARYCVLPPALRQSFPQTGQQGRNDPGCDEHTKRHTGMPGSTIEQREQRSREQTGRRRRHEPPTQAGRPAITPAQQRTNAHYQGQQYHQRSECHIEVRRAHRHASQIERRYDQRIQGPQQNRCHRNDQQDVVAQQCRFTRQQGKFAARRDRRRA